MDGVVFCNKKVPYIILVMISKDRFRHETNPYLSYHNSRRKFVTDSVDELDHV